MHAMVFIAAESLYKYYKDARKRYPFSISGDKKAAYI
jgi:hypothetical protein